MTLFFSRCSGMTFVSFVAGNVLFNRETGPLFYRGLFSRRPGTAAALSRIRYRWNSRGSKGLMSKSGCHLGDWL